MNWFSSLRVLALLRRLVIAAEGIERQLRYQNERTFPPVQKEKREPQPVVIGGVDRHRDEW